MQDGGRQSAVAGNGEGLGMGYESGVAAGGGCDITKVRRDRQEFPSVLVTVPGDSGGDSAE